MRWLPAASGLPRRFWFIWAGALVNRLGGFVIPFLTLYLTQVRRLSVERAGFIVGLYGVGAIFAGPLSGALADRIGRRPTLLGATLCGAAAMTHLGFARGEWHIALSTLVLGLCNDAYRPPMMAMVADLVGPDLRVRAFGLLYWAANLGFAVAAVVAGLLSGVSFSVLFIGDAATTLLFGALVVATVPETRAAAPTAREGGGLFAPYLDGVMVAFLVLSFVIACIFHQSVSMLPVDMQSHQISPKVFGQLIAINGFMIIILQPAIAELVRPFRRSVILAAGCFLVGAGFGLGAWARSPAGYAVVIVVFTFGEILMMPLGATVVADLAPAERRGSYQGAYQLAWSTSFFAAPALGAAVLGRFGARALWLGCFVLGAAAALGHLAIGPARRRRLAAMRAGEIGSAAQ